MPCMLTPMDVPVNFRPARGGVTTLPKLTAEPPPTAVKSLVSNTSVSPSSSPPIAATHVSFVVVAERRMCIVFSAACAANDKIPIVSKERT